MRAVFQRALRLSPFPRRNRRGFGPQPEPGGSRGVLQRVQAPILEVTVEYLGHSPAHLLGGVRLPRNRPAVLPLQTPSYLSVVS
jgi:hypothetical protein